MKFNLTTSGWRYTDEDKVRELAKYGLTFEPVKPPRRGWLHDKDGEVEISTLEELMQFVSEWGQIVLSADTVEIYDAYRE